MNEYLIYLDNQTKGLSNIEKLRYAYIDLGLRFNFDVKYSLELNPHKKEKTYNYSGTKSSIEKSFISNNVICKDTSEIIRIIGEYLGFNIKTVRYPFDNSNNLYHVYNEVTNPDGSKWSIDLQKDLKNIQGHMKTKNFGKKVNDYGYFINPHDLEVIDRKIGYLNEYYNDDYYLYIMKNDIDLINNFYDKLDLIFSNIEMDDYELGENERYFLHERILEELLSQEELNLLEEITCYKKENNNKKYFPAFLVKNEKGVVDYIYVFDLESNIYNKCTPIEFMDNYNKHLILTNDYDFPLIKEAAKLQKKLRYE